MNPVTTGIMNSISEDTYTESNRSVFLDSVYELTSSFDLSIYFLRDIQSDVVEFFEPPVIFNILKAYFPLKYSEIYQLVSNGRKVKLIPSQSRVSVRKRAHNPVTEFFTRFMSTSNLEETELDGEDVYYYGVEDEQI